MATSPEFMVMSDAGQTTMSQVNFIDITDPNKVVNEIDLDNVVLNDRQ